MLEKLKEGIHRVCIPFENLYTSVFFLTEGDKAIILDSGANDEDARDYIIPEILKLGLNPMYLITSHEHGDHCGGIEELQRCFPEAEHLSFAKDNIKDNDVILNRYKVLNLKGHCDDSLAVLDLKTNALLSCDCLQMYGVGRYGGNFDNYILYIASVNRLRSMNIHTIIASHDFVPYGFMAEGECEVEKYLNECERVVLEAVEYARHYPLKSAVDVADKYNIQHPDIPPISAMTVENIRRCD